MNEEAVKYAFDLFIRDGYKGDISKFQKLLETNQEALDYSFTLFERDGYKGGKDKYKVLMGLGETAAPVATTEPAKTEVVATTTEPAKTEPSKTEPAKTEPTATIATETAPTKTEVVAETKVAAEPMAKAEPQITVKEVEGPVKEEPKKELPVSTGLIPVTEKTEIKAVETPSDKMVIKSEKKAEEVKKEEWECSPGEKGCSKNEDVVSKYIDKTYHKNKKDYAFIADREGNLASFIDDGGRGKSMAEVYKDENYNHDKKGFMYAAEELPKSERFSTYSVPVNGVETSIVYDNKTGIILKDTGDVITNKQGNQVKTWLDVPTNNPEYQTLKAEIDKAKGGTTAPKASTVPTLEPWQQPQGNIQVKEVTEQPKMEVKEVTKEEPKGIPSYDDLGIEKGTNLLSNTPYVLPKGIKYKEMSPSEIISTVVDENGFISRDNIKLNRNTSLRYPDPPGTVFKKEKVGEREVYSSYDKANDKWYIYDENSNKDNWTEVKAGPVKALLNEKFSDKENKDKIDKVTEDERDLIDKTRNSVYVNVYMPYLLKNEDKLSDEETLKLQKMIKGIAHFKTLESHFKEEPFTGNLEEYLEKKEKRKNISDTREMPDLVRISDKKHLQIINDIVARTDNENGYFKEFFESKNYPTEKFSYSELENKKSNNELDSYKSILGTVFYDKNKDEFYWTEYDKKRIAREKYNHVYEGDKLEFDEKSQLPYLIIKKGTPDYDKIKSSLSKYNK